MINLIQGSEVDGKLLLNPAYHQEHRPLSLDERLDPLTSEGGSSSGVADEEDLDPRSRSVRHHPLSSPVVPRAETPPVRVRRQASFLCAHTTMIRLNLAFLLLSPNIPTSLFALYYQLNNAVKGCAFKK